MFNTIEEYMDWVHSLPEELQNVVIELWDVTGRPRTDFTQRRVVCKLLNMSDTFKEFSEKYRTVMRSGTDEQLAEYWDIYITGLQRAVDKLTDKSNKVA